MKTQHIIIALVVAAGLSGGAFYGGRQYEKSAVATAPASVRNFAGRQGGTSLSDPAGQRGMGQNGGIRRGGANGDGFVTGEVLSKDDQSLTIKTPDGGSTIAYFSAALSVRKAEIGSLSDLASGEQVTVTGKSNPDGSLSADVIQIMPPK
ncbi:MAG: hypothetical protein WAV46_01035 [Candidatus Moraniibacteriota bacterium]